MNESDRAFHAARIVYNRIFGVFAQIPEIGKLAINFIVN